MQLNTAITLTVGGETINLTTIDVVIMDYNTKKLVVARLAPFFKPLLLWKGEEYDSIGDYTQSQVEAKILELLGEDIQRSLQSLIIQE